MMKKTVLCLLLLLAITACRPRTKVADAQPSAPEAPVKGKPIAATYAFFEKVLIQPRPDYLKITSKMELQTPEASLPSVNTTLYMEKDKKVWLNATVLFLNIARAQATPAGIQAYEKTSRHYLDSDFAYLNNLLNVNFITFATLEKLLLGRTFIRIHPEEYQLKQTSEGYLLSSTVPQAFGGSGQADKYDVHLAYAPNYDLNALIIKNIRSRDQLEVRYEDWTAIDSIRLPQSVKINLKGSQPGEISIQNTKFELEKMNAPFSIPKNYSKIEIK